MTVTLLHVLIDYNTLTMHTCDRDRDRDHV
jgi:hypothetical protein